MMRRTSDPEQALANARAVLGQDEPSQDDVLFALLDLERAVIDQPDGDLTAELESARLSLTGL